MTVYRRLDIGYGFLFILTTSVLSGGGGPYFAIFSKLPPASLEWRPFRATADFSGPSRAHGMAGKIPWAENAGERHFCMAALVRSPG